MKGSPGLDGVENSVIKRIDSNFLLTVKSTLEMVIPTMMSATTLKGSSVATTDCVRMVKPSRSYQLLRLQCESTKFPFETNMITKDSDTSSKTDQATGNLYTFNGAVLGTASPDNTERNLRKELDLLVVHWQPYDGVTMKWGPLDFHARRSKARLHWF